MLTTSTAPMLASGAQIDTPPGTSDEHLSIVGQMKETGVDGAIIVTTPHSLSLVDVAKGIVMFEKVNVSVLGLVENMSYFVCDQCEKKHHLFGAGAKSLQERFGLGTLAELPIVDGISNLSAPDAGADLKPIRALCENVHREVGRRRAAKPHPFPHHRNRMVSQHHRGGRLNETFLSQQHVVEGIGGGRRDVQLLEALEAAEVLQSGFCGGLPAAALAPFQHPAEAERGLGAVDASKHPRTQEIFDFQRQ